MDYSHSMRLNVEKSKGMVIGLKFKINKISTMNTSNKNLGVIVIVRHSNSKIIKNYIKLPETLTGSVISYGYVVTCGWSVQGSDDNHLRVADNDRIK